MTKTTLGSSEVRALNLQSEGAGFDPVWVNLLIIIIYIIDPKALNTTDIYII